MWIIIHKVLQNRTKKDKCDDHGLPQLQWQSVVKQLSDKTCLNYDRKGNNKLKTVNGTNVKGADLFPSLDVNIDSLQHQVQTFPVAKRKVSGLDCTLLRPWRSWSSLLLPPVRLQNINPSSQKFLKIWSNAHIWRFPAKILFKKVQNMYDLILFGICW